MPNARPWLYLALALLMLAGCSAAPTSAASPTATIAPTPTPTTPPAPTIASTPAATPTIGLTTRTDFTCGATTNGATTTFFDAPTGLRFSYPSTWNEPHCQRSTFSDGSSELAIGHIFRVHIIPRNGLTIQQMVNQQADQNETVTLTPLAVAHAQDAAAITVTVPSGVQYDREPFSFTFAIVAGLHNFYSIIHNIALTDNYTDTTPPLSVAQITQQVITTFDVP